VFGSVAYFSNYVIGMFGLGDYEWRWKLANRGVSAAAFSGFAVLYSREARAGW